MNRSIVSLVYSDNDVVRACAQKLVQYAPHRVRIVFTKKDGSERTMVVDPSLEWNWENKIKTTEEGRKIVVSKVRKDMATIVEICPSDADHAEEWKQPRTINLATIIKMEELVPEAFPVANHISALEILRRLWKDFLKIVRVFG